jgi:hypothetical protein
MQWDIRKIKFAQPQACMVLNECTFFSNGLDTGLGFILAGPSERQNKPQKCVHLLGMHRCQLSKTSFKDIIT